jgi:hypothetical protein
MATDPVRQALEQARERLSQCARDRTERDKVLAQATTGIAEIDAALAASPAPVRDAPRAWTLQGFPRYMGPPLVVDGPEIERGVQVCVVEVGPWVDVPAEGGES